MTQKIEEVLKKTKNFLNLLYEDEKQIDKFFTSNDDKELLIYGKHKGNHYNISTYLRH